MSFKVGDEVRIRRSSDYYGDDNSSNPRDVIGVIESIYTRTYHRDSHSIYVNWPGCSNNYRGEDLERPEKILLEI